jgi:hypothetical protein
LAYFIYSFTVGIYFLQLYSWLILFTALQLAYFIYSFTVGIFYLQLYIWLILFTALQLAYFIYSFTVGLFYLQLYSSYALCRFNELSSKGAGQADYRRFYYSYHTTYKSDDKNCSPQSLERITAYARS